MPELRILQIDDGLTWGGGQDQVRLLAEGLAAEGVVSMVATPRGSELAKRLSPAVRQFPLSRSRGLVPLDAFRIAAFCKRQGVDLVDVHTGSAYGLGLFAKILAPKVKLVFHRHIDTQIKQRLFTRFKYLHGAIDGFIAVSEAVRQSLLEYGIDPARIGLCWGGVDSSLYDADAVKEARAKLLAMADFPPETFLVGSVGRLVAQKDYPTLIESMDLVRRHRPEIRCVLIGEGKDRATLEADVAQRDLQRQVKFLGFQANVHELIGGIDVFVLPSVMEGFGLVLVEAALAGSCLVTSDIRSVMDFIEDGSTALTFEAKNAAALATRILSLAQDSTLRATLCGRARQIAADKFTIKHMVGRNLAEYRRIIRRDGLLPSSPQAAAKSPRPQ